MRCIYSLNILLCTGLFIVCMYLSPVDAPFILLEPEDLFLLPGDDASFRVGVTGGSLGYQWRLDGQDLADMEGEIGGSSTPNLTVYNVSDADLGLYSCFVSNLAASVSSRNATLGFGKG